MNWTRLTAIALSATLLGGCTTIKTNAHPVPVTSNSVPFGLLDPTIPFTNQLRVTFAERTIYFVNLAGQLVPLHRLLPTPHTLIESLDVMTAGPSSAEAANGIATYVPTVVKINQASLHKGVGYVDVSPVFLSLSPVGQQRATAQIVMTSLAAGATKGVRLTVAQEPFVANLPNGRHVSVVTPADVSYLVQR